MTSGKAFTYAMPLEVYFQTARVRGVLATNQDRLSNFLIVRQGEEVFSLKNASLEIFNRKTAPVTTDEYLIYMQEVCLIADLSSGARIPDSGMEALYVKKEQRKALFSVGPYLLHGNLHLRPSAAFHDLFMGNSQFFPVTDAILMGRQEVVPRTYLVNRAKIGFMSAIGDKPTTEL